MIFHSDILEQIAYDFSTCLLNLSRIILKKVLLNWLKLGCRICCNNINLQPRSKILAHEGYK